MTDQEIRQRFHRAADRTLSGLEGDPLLSQRIILRAQPKEEPKMKKKISIGFAIVLALMLMSMTALAAGLSLNLFEYFGRTDKHWADLAERAVLETEAPVPVAHETLGETKAAITNAYYDGEKLMAAYMVEGGQQVIMWAPDSEAMALLEPEGAPEELRGADVIGAGLKDLKKSLEEAVAAEQPIGYIKRTVWLAEDVTANGVRVEAYMSEEEARQDGAFYQLVEFVSPLPESIRDQKSLELRMPLEQVVTYHWFDGSSWFGRSEEIKDAGEMTTTVKRDAQAGR